MNNPFDLDALDIKVSNAENFAEAEPLTTKVCVTISLLSNLCCEVLTIVAGCNEAVQ